MRLFAREVMLVLKYRYIHWSLNKHLLDYYKLSQK